MKQSILLRLLAVILTFRGGIALAQTVSILHSFSSNGLEGDMADDNDLDYRLVQARDGNLYGTTPFAGAGGGYGTVFRLSPGGSFTNLVSFDGLNCQALYTTNQAGWVRSYGLFTGTPTVPPGFQPGLPASTKMRKSPSPTSAPPASAKSPSSTWST